MTFAADPTEAALGAPDPAAGSFREGLRIVALGARQQPGTFIASVLGSAGYGAATAAAGFLLGVLTDQVLVPAFAGDDQAAARLPWAAGGLAGLALFTAAMVAIRRIAGGLTQFRLQARYRAQVTRQYLRLPPSWHQQHPAGALLSGANSDVEAIWQVMAPLPLALGVLVMLVVSGAAMLWADVLLGTVGLLVLPMILLANTVYQRRMAPAVMLAQQLKAELSQVAHESLEAAEIVKTLGRERAEVAEFAEHARRLQKANVRAGQLRAAFDPVVDALPTTGILLVLMIGTWRVATGASATGDLVQVAYLLGVLAFPLRATGWVLGELPRTVVGWRRVQAVLTATGELPYGSQELPGSGAVDLCLQDVHFRFDGSDSEVLRGIDLTVPAGRVVAVVGPTAAGKSTLAALLVRLLDPVQGRVSVDGTDLRRLRASALTDAICLVSQEAFIFDDTVRGNVLLQDPAADPAARREQDDRLALALRQARADGFVAALPHGVDTRVGERGTTLSGGQRQRLALARALVRRPRLLVLDDATSALDPQVESQVLAGLRQTGATVVVIAYRRATIALADEVIFLQEGAIRAQGPHEQLFREQGDYRDLVSAYDSPAER